MRTGDKYQKEFIDQFNELSRIYGGEAVFRDWAEMFALALANGCCVIHGEQWNQREQRYLSIMERYTKGIGGKDEYKDTFAKMSAILTDWFDYDPFNDHLGRLYMEVFGGNKNLGQCFTPIGVCELCAQVCVGTEKQDGTPATPSNPITINDCACGGGAMLIAACKALHERRFDWQKCAVFYANDLDSLCVHMCYIQLSLLGARAVVERRDTLTMKLYDRFITHMEVLWPAFIQFKSGEEINSGDIIPSNSVQTKAQPAQMELKFA